MPLRPQEYVLHRGVRSSDGHETSRAHITIQHIGISSSGDVPIWTAEGVTLRVNSASDGSPLTSPDAARLELASFLRALADDLSAPIAPPDTAPSLTP